MQSFKFYLDANMARKISPDPVTAGAILERASKRLEYVQSQEITHDNAPFVFEQIYEVIRECGQSLMIKEGYKPVSSHEVIIAFLKDKYGDVFTEKLINDFNRFRIMRNESMYNADHISVSSANKALTIAVTIVRITKGADR